MKKNIKFLISSLVCAFVVGTVAQASINWGGKATPVSNGMIANAYTSVANDTSFYSVTAKLTFRNADGTVYSTNPSYGYVDSSGNANAATGDVLGTGRISRVQSYHVWYSRSGDGPAEVVKTLY